MFFSKQKTISVVAALTTAIGFAGVAQASNFITPNFSGNTDYDAWNDLTITNPQIAAAGFPGFAGSTSPWPEPIESNLTAFSDGGTPGDTSDDGIIITDPTGNAAFDKVTGGGYPAGESIYNSFTPGTFRVFDNDVVAGLANVLFQVEIAPGVDDFFGPNPTPGTFRPDGMPVLNYNGGSQALDPIFSSVTPTGETFDNPVPPPAEVSVDAFAFQWDLTGLGPITEYEIVWITRGLTTNYGMQLDASDTFTVIPEPASLVLLGLGAATMMSRRRRV